MTWDLEYTQRLSKLSLPSLEFSHLRGDFIEAYKLAHNIYDPITTNNLFTFSDYKTTSTRAHSFKLNINKSPNTVQYKILFSNRITQLWNNLPEDMVCVDYVNLF